MSFKITPSSKKIEGHSSIAQTLAKLDKSSEPIPVGKFIADKLDKFYPKPELIMTAIYQTRESVGRQAVIYTDIMQGTQCVLDMHANRDICYLSGAHNNQIIMAYNIFMCEDELKTLELLIYEIAKLATLRIYHTLPVIPKFYQNMLYYLMGFDPMKEQLEKAEAKKLLGG